MEYRVISPLNNKSTLLNSSKIDTKSNKNTNSPKIMQKVNGFDSPEYENISKR